MTRSSIGHGHANGVGELLEVEDGLAVLVHGDVASEVDAAQVADGSLVLACDLGDLSAEVREVNDIAVLAGLVALQVGGVLERHPAVAGFCERTHHAQVQVARLYLAVILLVGFGLFVRDLEVVAVKVRQRGNVAGVEQRPHRVGFHALHKEVGNPVGEVQVVGAARAVAGVLAEFEEAVDIRVPWLEVHAAGALALATLVDGSDGGVQRAQPRNDAVRQAVRCADERAFRTHAVERQANATGEL